LHQTYLLNQFADSPIRLFTQFIIQIFTWNSTSMSHNPMCSSPERLQITRLSNSFIVNPSDLGGEGCIEDFGVVDNQFD